MRRHSASIRSSATVLAGIAATALVACGGGVSRADFLAKADGACAPSTSELAAVAKPSSLPELATAAATMAAAADGQAAALRAVKAPGSDKDAVTGIATAIGGVAAPARALQESAEKKDDAATAKAANEVMAKAKVATAQSEAYGFTQCGKGMQAPVGTVFEGATAVLKAGFVARAESLCQAAGRKVDALASPTSLATYARYMTAYLPIETRLFVDIKTMPAPPGDEGTIAEMIGAQDKVIDSDKQIQAAAQAKDESLLERVEEENAVLVTQANAKFDAYGIRSCGTGGAF